jgi:hypothetical protein
MSTPTPEECPLCTEMAAFELIGAVRKYFRCLGCGEFVVASLAERLLRSSVNEGRKEALRKQIADAGEGNLVVIERDPLESGSSPSLTAITKPHTEALRR